MTDAFDITHEEFDKLFDSAVAWSNEILKDKPKSIMPYLSVLCVDKSMEKSIVLIAINSDFNDWDEKVKIMSSLGRKLAREKLVALAAVLMSEAWLSSKAFDEDVQPRHASDRTECITIAGMSIDKKFVRMLCQPILRYNGGMMADGKVIHDSNEIKDAKPEFPLMHPFFGEHIKQWDKQLNT